jgi:hypothetical protein
MFAMSHDVSWDSVEISHLETKSGDHNQEMRFKQRCSDFAAGSLPQFLKPPAPVMRGQNQKFPNWK